jgi:type IV fimbrial biogenesis protein FimT
MQGGATLLEIVIAVTILGIVSSVFVITYREYMPQARLNGAAREVMSDLMLARRQAVSQTQRVRVYFANNQQYKVCYDANGDGTVEDCEGNSQIKNIQKNYDGVTLSANNNPIFYPRGTATNLPTIAVSTAGMAKKKCITVSTAGRIKVCEHPRDQNCDC